MKKPSFIFLILTLSFLVVTQSSFTGLSGPGKQNVKKFALKLFNGKNLDGWYTFIKDRGKNVDPKKVFTVSNGMIRISGEEYGCITTNDEFENYKLTVNYKWGEITYAPRIDRARDSGILLHSVGEDGGSDDTWMHSIECQIIEGGTGDFIVVGDGSSDFSITCPVAPEKQGSSYVYKPGGDMATINSGRINWFARDPGWKDVKGFRGASDIEVPVGKWNKLECVVKDREIHIYLNGTLVNHAVDVKPHKGRIQIQSEGAEIFIKQISIKKL
ncbi:MAG: DUF1080 domain-containing protein [Bacteroidales bacterium]